MEPRLAARADDRALADPDVDDTTATGAERATAGVIAELDRQPVELDLVPAVHRRAAEVQVRRREDAGARHRRRSLHRRKGIGETLLRALMVQAREDWLPGAVAVGRGAQPVTDDVRARGVRTRPRGGRGRVLGDARRARLRPDRRAQGSCLVDPLPDPGGRRPLEPRHARVRFGRRGDRPFGDVDTADEGPSPPPRAGSGGSGSDNQTSPTRSAPAITQANGRMIASARSHRSPSRAPIQVSAITQGRQPSTVLSTVKRQNRVRTTPAGRLMKVRITGRRRPKKTAACPCRSNHAWASPPRAAVSTGIDPPIDQRAAAQVAAQ